MTIDTTHARTRAAIVAVAPTVMLVGFLYHPFIAVIPRDVEDLAAAVVADPTRWGIAHLTVGVASGLLVLAFLALRHELRAAGDERWSAFGVPFVVIGSTLFTLLPGMEFAPLTAAETGGNALAAQEALEPWFIPVLAFGALTFAIGTFGFCKGLWHHRVLSRRTTAVVVTALAVMAASRFVPLGVVQFHVQGVAGVVALWPLAYRMWHPAVADPEHRLV